MKSKQQFITSMKGKWGTNREGERGREVEGEK